LGSQLILRARQSQRSAYGAFSVFDNSSLQVLSLILAGISIVSVFHYIPFVSEMAFWVMLAAYGLLTQYKPPEEKK
jgi:hypothetical protein